jgi:Fe-S-cluster containining protein
MLKDEHKIGSEIDISCLSCSKCCYKTIPYLDVELTLSDIKRIPAEYIERRQGGDGDTESIWLKRNGIACIALDEATKSCKIYDIRPKECKEFEKGNELCLKLVKNK